VALPASPRDLGADRAREIEVRPRPRQARVPRELIEERARIASYRLVDRGREALALDGLHQNPSSKPASGVIAKVKFGNSAVARTPTSKPAAVTGAKRKPKPSEAKPGPDCL